MRSIARRIFKQPRAAPLLIQTVNRTRRRNLRFVRTFNCWWTNLRICTETNCVSELRSAFTKFSVVQYSGLGREPKGANNDVSLVRYTLHFALFEVGWILAQFLQKRQLYNPARDMSVSQTFYKCLVTEIGAEFYLCVGSASLALNLLCKP